MSGFDSRKIKLKESDFYFGENRVKWEEEEEEEEKMEANVFHG